MAVLEFKYPGRFLEESYDDWMAVVGDLMKAWKRWVRMLRILLREGSYPHSYRNFYKAVVQSTLLFGADSWMMSPILGMKLSGFHQRVDFRLEKCSLRWTERSGVSIRRWTRI